MSGGGRIFSNLRLQICANFEDVLVRLHRVRERCAQWRSFNVARPGSIVIKMAMDMIMPGLADNLVADYATDGEVLPSQRHRVPPHPHAFAWHHPRPDFFRDRSFLRESCRWKNGRRRRWSQLTAVYSVRLPGDAEPRVLSSVARPCSRSAPFQQLCSSGRSRWWSSVTQRVAAPGRTRRK